jgi:hypothetical protein
MENERINDQNPALILGDVPVCVLFMYICATGLRLIKGKLSGVEEIENFSGVKPGLDVGKGVSRVDT